MCKDAPIPPIISHYEQAERSTDCAAGWAKPLRCRRCAASRPATQPCCPPRRSHTATIPFIPLEDPHQNAPKILIIPGCAPDLGGRNFSSGSPRTVTCALWKNLSNWPYLWCSCSNWAEILCMCAISLVKTAGPFSAQLEHLSYCELDLDYLDLLDFKLEQIRGHFC